MGWTALNHDWVTADSIHVELASSTRPSCGHFLTSWWLRHKCPFRLALGELGKPEFLFHVTFPPQTWGKSRPGSSHGVRKWGNLCCWGPSPTSLPTNLSGSLLPGSTGTLTVLRTWSYIVCTDIHQALGFISIFFLWLLHSCPSWTTVASIYKTDDTFTIPSTHVYWVPVARQEVSWGRAHKADTDGRVLATKELPADWEERALFKTTGRGAGRARWGPWGGRERSLMGRGQGCG